VRSFLSHPAVGGGGCRAGRAALAGVAEAHAHTRMPTAGTLKCTCRQRPQVPTTPTTKMPSPGDVSIFAVTQMPPRI